MKGVSPWVSFVIVTALLITSVALTWHSLAPVWRRAREGAIIREAMDNMRALDAKIWEVIAEGKGAARRIPLTISQGVYAIDAEREWIEFVMQTKEGALEPGLYIKENNLLIVTGATAAASTNGSHLILENDLVRIIFRNVTNSLWGLIAQLEFVGSPPVEPANSSVIFDGNPSLSVGPVISSILRVGPRLAKAEVKFELANRSVYFTLPAHSDYLEVRATGDLANLTLSLAFHLAASNTDDIIYIPGIQTGNISAIEAGCWDAASLPLFAICSHDTELTPTLAFLWVHTGALVDFHQLCWANYTPTDYELNLTSGRQLIGSLTQGECQPLAERIELDEYEQRVPPTLADLPAPEAAEEYEIVIALEFEDVDLQIPAGEGSTLRPGTRYVCLRYAGVTDTAPVIEVWPC